MDVFDLSDAVAAYLRDAVVAAAHELGVLDRRPAQPTRRMRQLLDLVAAFGVSNASASPAPVGPGGWGELAGVIRRDRPLPANDANALRRLHAHLVTAGASVAAEVATLLPAGWLVDLGGGAGVYSTAYLAQHSGARATLVDLPEVIAIAREHVGEHVALVASDIREVTIEGADVALLANVLHVVSAETCAELCRVAARCVAPGGLVVIKEMRVDEERRGPLASLVFAMNMGLFTDEGDVYETPQLRAWLEGAGLVDITEHRLTTSLDSIVITARKP